MLDCNITAGFSPMFTSRYSRCKRNWAQLCRRKKDGGLKPPSFAKAGSLLAQVRRVSTKFCPLTLVQLSCEVEINKQLKLIGVWRISEVPWIWTEVPPVMA